MNSQNVRLSEEYINTIKLLALRHFNSTEVKIFGSRADMNKKGGDIDIYIKTKMNKNILDAKIAFLRDFELKHGEQRIDLIVHSKSDRTKKIFEIAEREGITL